MPLPKTLTERIIELLHSPRFLQLLLVGLSAGLAVYNTTKDLSQALFATLVAWLVPSTIVGTVDRSADKKVEAANLVARATVDAANPQIPPVIPGFNAPGE